MRLAFLVVALGVLAPAGTAVAARPCNPGQLEFLRTALDSNRLIQVERMIASMQPTCREHRSFMALTARWALRTGRSEQALSLYLRLMAQAPNDPELVSGAGRAAYHAGRIDQAYQWLSRATALPNADWRAWSALGVLHDRRREWEASERAYARAAQLAPNQAAIWNNRGYSLLLQRRFAEALIYLDRAYGLDPNDEAVRRTRTIGHAMAGRFDPARRPRESAREWADRLNNMGYAAWLAGDTEAARRLLAQAIEASDTRFARAEANLARVEGRE
jgi:Flp pilus assembly protein TadD